MVVVIVVKMTGLVVVLNVTKMTGSAVVVNVMKMMEMSPFIAHNELSLMSLVWLYSSCIDNYTYSDFRPFTIYKTKIVYKKI